MIEKPMDGSALPTQQYRLDDMMGNAYRALSNNDGDVAKAIDDIFEQLVSGSVTLQFDDTCRSSLLRAIEEAVYKAASHQ